MLATSVELNFYMFLAVLSLLCYPQWSPLSLSCLTCHSTTLRGDSQESHTHARTHTPHTHTVG